MFRLLLAVIITSFTLGTVGAQDNTSDNSPLTYNGVGKLNTTNTTTYQNMGGAAFAKSSVRHFNLDNPASLGALRYTTSDVGAFLQFAKIKDEQGRTNNAVSGNVGYLALAFPVFNPDNEVLLKRPRTYNWGMGFNLKPISSVGYDIISDQAITPGDTLTTQFKGSGGLYQVSWANGITKGNSSIGVDLSYRFGQVNDERINSFSNSNLGTLSTNFTESQNIRGFGLGLGVQHKVALDSLFPTDSVVHTNRFFKNLSIGAYVNTDLGSKSFYQTETVRSLDTTFSSDKIKSDVEYPTTMGVGISLYNNASYSLALDYSATNWSSLSGYRTGSIVDAWKVKLGGEYIPEFTDVDNYANRIRYRAGTYFQKENQTINGDDIFNYGLTLGLGLPSRLRDLPVINHYNVGLNVGQYTTLGSDNYSELYLQLNFSMSLSDNNWFFKPKID